MRSRPDLPRTIAAQRRRLRLVRPPIRAVVTTEAPAAPILLSLYGEAGLAGRAELTPRQALRLASDLLGLALAKDRWTAPRRRPSEST